MNIPNLPTDNLYKFMALFGLFSFSVSMFLMNDTEERNAASYAKRSEILIKNNYELERIKKIATYNNVNFRHAMFKVRQEIREEDSLLEEKDIDFLLKDSLLSLPKIVNSVSSETLGFLVDETMRADSISEAVNELNELRVNSISHIEDDIERSLSLYFFLLLVNSISIVVILIGFMLWYVKHQKYMDAEREWEGEKLLQLLKEAKEIDKAAKKPTDQGKESDS